MANIQLSRINFVMSNMAYVQKILLILISVLYC